MRCNGDRNETKTRKTRAQVPRVAKSKIIYGKSGRCKQSPVVCPRGGSRNGRRPVECQPGGDCEIENEGDFEIEVDPVPRKTAEHKEAIKELNEFFADHSTVDDRIEDLDDAEILRRFLEPKMNA